MNVEAEKQFTLPILGWTVYMSAQGWRLRFQDGREDWPTPRERQIIFAFRIYAQNAQDTEAGFISSSSTRKK